MKHHPMFDYLALKQAKLPEKIGSLHIPERARNAQPFGEVVAIGPDVKHVEVGEKVFFSDLNAIGVPADPEFLLIVQEKDLRCKVEGDFADIITADLGLN